MAGVSSRFSLRARSQHSGEALHSTHTHTPPGCRGLRRRWRFGLWGKGSWVSCGSAEQDPVGEPQTPGVNVSLPVELRKQIADSGSDPQLCQHVWTLSQKSIMRASSPVVVHHAGTGPWRSVRQPHGIPDVDGLRGPPFLRRTASDSWPKEEATPACRKNPQQRLAWFLRCLQPQGLDCKSAFVQTATSIECGCEAFRGNGRHTNPLRNGRPEGHRIRRKRVSGKSFLFVKTI